MKIQYILMLASLMSVNSFAGVYKCTDAQGKTSYQSSPCSEAKQAFEMNITTGTAIDLAEKDKQQKQIRDKQREQELLEQQHLEQIEHRRNEALRQTTITKELIKNNPKQYSAYAIPAYNPDELPILAEQFKERLPEIEKFRRLAAQMALKSGRCNRVESDEISVKSQPGKLVFQVDCSSGKNFFISETQLKEP